MSTRGRSAFDPSTLAGVAKGRAAAEYKRKEVIFSQGDAANSVFYLWKGRVQLAVVSEHGKEAVIAILGPGDFFGEGCLAGQHTRVETASAITDCSIVRLERRAMIHVLHENPGFADLFLSYLLSRNIRFEEDLVDHLFNSSEKRLARVLLLLAGLGKGNGSEAVVPKISQETLAEMVGTTRSRISFFMNRFRKLGFIEYNGELRVRAALVNVIHHE